MISLTPAAQEQLAAVLKDNSNYKAIRIGVRGGGCSGFEYSIGLIDKPEVDWEKTEYPTVTIYVDPISIMYLSDVEIDYIESLEQSGFKFNNPNVRTQCGCGKSFSV